MYIGSLDLNEEDTVISSDISFKMYQGIGRIQIIWLVFRYFSKNKTQSNHLTCLLIFFLWKDGMTRLRPITHILHCSDVDNHYVIVSSHGTDVLPLLAHNTRIPGRNIWMKPETSKTPTDIFLCILSNNSWIKVSFWRYHVFTSTCQCSISRVLCCEAVQHKWCR